MKEFLKKLLPLPTTRKKLWMDVLCMWIVSMALCIAFDQAFRFHAPIWHMALSVTLTIGIMWLCYGKLQWLFAGVLSVIVVVFCAAWAAFGWDTVWTHIIGFLKWWVALFPRDSIYNHPHSIIFVQTLIHIGMALASWIYVRVVRSGLLLIFSSVHLLCFLYFNGYPKLFWPSVLLILGVFPLFARNFYDKGRRDRKNAVSELFSRNRLQVFIIAVCLLVSLGLTALLPANTDDWIVADMYVGFHDMLDALGLQVPEESDYKFDTLKSMGLAPYDGKLGGNISQDHENLLMTVEAPVKVPLGGRIYDVYTGEGWRSDTITAYKYNSRASAERKELVMGTYEPHIAFCYNLDPGFEDMTFRIRYTGNYSTMYTAGRVKSAQLLKLPRVNVMFNDRGEIFANQKPEGYSYYYTTDLRCSRVSQNFVNDVNGLVRRTLAREDPAYDRIAEQYLQLPDSLPDSVRQKAAEIVGDDCETAYQVCERLETYLRTHYTYTLKPGKVPDGVDFVAHFLNTGKGYCTYFATAMAVMARAEGVPARLVAGYGLEDTEKFGTYNVYPANAHAWVECYFYGVGWVAFDPTAGSDYLPALEYKEMEFDDPQTETIDTEPASDEPQYETEVEWIVEDDEIHPEDYPEDLLRWWDMPVWSRCVWIGAMVILLLIVYSLARLLWLRVRYMPAYAIKRHRRRRLADFYYEDFLKQYRHLGFVPATGETLPQFERRLAGCGESNDDTRRLVTMLCDWKYGEAPITEDQVYFLGHVHGDLELRVRRRMNGVKYWFSRVFLTL